jgi:solute carrier family 25 folate transporter 32
MSHERSTPASSGSREFATPPPTPQHFSQSRNEPNNDSHISMVEGFVMGRSDSSFNAVAGAAGGFMSGIVTCPLDVIKTKLQAQGGFRAAKRHLAQPAGAIVYNGMFGTANVIWKEEGLRGLYRGLGPIILGYLPTWAVWFTVYGKSKAYFAAKDGEPAVIAKLLWRN